MGVPGSVINVNENIFDMLKKTELFMSNTGKTAEAIAETRKEVFQIAEKYELEAAAQTSLLPGAVDALRDLQKMGVKRGLCTINSANSTQHILDRFKVAEYFDAVIPRDQVSQYKPNPEHCNAALKALGVSAAETVMVGDSVTDMQAAVEVKAIAVGLPTGVSTQEQLLTQGANYIVTSITDLPRLVDCLNKPNHSSN
jgi:HAD superfamily hydrolase (TIGR01549 family)